MENSFLRTDGDRPTELRNLRISYLQFVVLFDVSKTYLSLAGRCNSLE